VYITQFKQSSAETVMMAWDDGHRGPVSLRSLRDACPCAGCQGETVLLHHYAAPPPATAAPGRYELKGAAAVGNYAMQFRWGDGHGEGIYTWETLRSLCECPECSARNPRGRRNGDEQ
jgi:DUF971 family protein